jgi:hypothetical protein
MDTLSILKMYAAELAITLATAMQIFSTVSESGDQRPQAARNVVFRSGF